MILDNITHKLVILIPSGNKVTELMIFKINVYRQGWKTEEDRIKLTMITNNSEDESYNESFNIYRRDLEEEK